MIRPCVLLVTTAAALFLRCGTSTEVAGGSGAGNPGGITAVAIIADTIAIAPSQPKRASDTSRTLIVADDGGMALHITSARITVYEIHFMLEDSLSCTALLDTFGSSGLACDQEGIALQGPFVFDAVTGDADLVFDTLRLPIASYRGIKLAIGCTDEESSLVCSPVEIKGSFTYRDSLRSLAMSVRFNTVLLHKYIGPPVDINPNDTTVFTLTLDARQWLSTVALSPLLDAGSIQFDSSGTLVLDSEGEGIQGREVVRVVRENLNSSLKSALLEISAQR